MSLHSLLSVTIGVPNVGETAAYYADFGLTPSDDGWFSTADAGRQLDRMPDGLFARYGLTPSAFRACGGDIQGG